MLSSLSEKYSADRLLVLPLDVTVPDQIVGAFARAKEAFGRIDVVVNNAGFLNLGEVEGVEDGKARAVLETNFWGAANVSREAVKFFREVNPAGIGGRLLQFSSLAGVTGMPGVAYYCATKFGQYSALRDSGYAAVLTS